MREFENSRKRDRGWLILKDVPEYQSVTESKFLSDCLDERVCCRYGVIGTDVGQSINWQFA